MMWNRPLTALLANRIGRCAERGRKVDFDLSGIRVLVQRGHEDGGEAGTGSVLERPGWETVQNKIRA